MLTMIDANVRPARTERGATLNLIWILQLTAARGGAVHDRTDASRSHQHRQGGGFSRFIVRRTGLTFMDAPWDAGNEGYLAAGLARGDAANPRNTRTA